MRLCAPAVLCVLLGSCSSTAFLLPGEDQAHGQNIAASYVSVAQSYEDVKNYAKAIESYRLAMQYAGSDAVYYRLGRCYALSGDWGNARAVYGELLAKDAGNVSLKRSLAYVTAMSGDLPAAVTQYGELAAQSGQDAEIQRDFAAVLLAAGEYGRAAAQLALLEERFPDDEGIPALKEKLSAAAKK